MVLLLLALGLYLAGPIDQQPKSADLDIPVAHDSTAAAALAVANAGLRVELRLEEGEFRILPGDSAQGIHVEAQYDEAVHHLESTHEPAEAGGRSVFRLDFGAGGGLEDLRRVVHGQRTPDTFVRVTLPRGVPIQLSVRSRRGALELDLTGLSIEELTLDCAMGNFGVEIDEPNPVAMQRLDIRFRMGDLHASGLGNAGANALRLKASMGNAELRFDGDWRSDLIADIDVIMGDAKLSVPREVALDTQEARVFLGGFEDRDRAPLRRDPESTDQPKLLRAEVFVKLGSVSIR